MSNSENCTEIESINNENWNYWPAELIWTWACILNYLDNEDILVEIYSYILYWFQNWFAFRLLVLIVRYVCLWSIALVGAQSWMVKGLSLSIHSLFHQDDQNNAVIACVIPCLTWFSDLPIAARHSCPNI